MEENQGTSGAVELSNIAVEMSTVAVDMSTDVVESQDFTSSFKTDTIFATREELLTWVRAVGKSLGMVIVIGRSDTGRRSGKQYCMLICDKAGSYKTNVEEGTNTRKCCCPFRLKGKFIKKLGGWILRVMDGTHNHGLATYHEGRPYIGRLTSEEKELMARMTRNHTRPKLILNELKLMKPDDNYTVDGLSLNQCRFFCRVMMDCTPIPLSMIHQHWQRLNFKIQSEVVDDELSLDIELEAIKRRFEASDHAGRVMMKAKARELAFPDTTSMCPPPDTITTKGAPKKDKKGNVDHSTKRDKSYWEHVDNKFDSGSSSGCFAQSRKRPTPPQSRSGTPTNPHSSGSTPTPTLSTCPTPNPLQSKKRTQADSATTIPTPPLHKKPTPTPIVTQSATATISTAHTLTPAPALTPNPIVTDMDAAAIDVFNTYIIGMPEFMRPYVEKIVNVVGDGNCGFRCIAAFLGRGEEAWQSVRTDLMDELNQYNDFYTGLYGGIGKVTFLMKALLRAHHGPNIEDNWMTVPDMGYLISNKYKVVLTCWSPNCCYTIFPFNVAPFRSARQFNILLVPQHKHFVQVFMKLGSPMSVPDLIWNTNRAPIAKGWDSLFISRMQKWRSLIVQSQLPHPPHCVDLSKDSDGSQC